MPLPLPWAMTFFNIISPRCGFNEFELSFFLIGVFILVQGKDVFGPIEGQGIIVYELSIGYSCHKHMSLNIPCKSLLLACNKCPKEHQGQLTDFSQFHQNLLFKL